MGLTQQFQEDSRQERTDDRKFLGFVDGVALLYFFELRVPEEVGGKFGTSFLFPLALSPTDITEEEPFTVNAEPTQGGGLHVEENGIIQRMISIRGHTGFRPRRAHASNFGTLRTGDEKSFSRDLGLVPSEAISGHRYFQFLQDKVFRTYADLKKDPRSSKDTFLFWHNQKDDEHWVVVPQRFRLERRLQKRVLYEYDIQLLAVAKAEDVDSDFSEDKGWLDEAKDVFRTINAAIDIVTAAINDVTRIVAELEQFVGNIGRIINNAIGIINAASDFVNGVTSFIKAPFQSVVGILSSLDSALEEMSDAIEAGANIPDDVQGLIRQIGDGFAQLGTHPEAFQTDTTLRLEQLRQLAELSSAQNQERIAEAASREPLNTLAAFRALGTRNLPRDFERVRAELGIGRLRDTIKSLVEHRVTSSDTLPGIAARSVLGDARQWRVIAVINNLRAPYISREGIPNTVKPGDKILIPSGARPQSRQPLAPVLGASPDLPTEERFLGVDFELQENANGLLEMVIDTTKGSNDVRLVRGLANLAQGLRIRVDTEQGSDPMYLRMGRKRFMSTTIVGLDRELAGFRVGEAVNADPRIAAVRNVRLTTTTPADARQVSLDAEVRGFSETFRFEV